MRRAAVLIGVDRTGLLPKLNDAAKGARRMEQWARGQGFEWVKVLTDENGSSVTLGDIFKAVKEAVDKGVYGQLVVYFAGHGINLGYSERWLLSDAPADPNAAVNLNSSAELAHHCGIPHVVFISDACRSAAEGINAQAVDGGVIFPNLPVNGPERDVDRFWACTVGDPAAEIRDAKDAAGEYRALFTDSLLEPLQGKVAELIELDGGLRVVRPRPLKPWLRDQLAKRTEKLKTSYAQVPDARITSDDHVFIAQIAQAAPPGAGAPPPGPTEENLIRAVASIQPEVLTQTLLQRSISGIEADFTQGLDVMRGQGSHVGKGLADAYLRHAEPFGPPHFETQCGFKVRGAGIAELLTSHKGEILAPDLARMDLPVPAANVILVFEDGSGVALPAIDGFICGLTLRDGRLVDVAYEPSDNSGRWAQFNRRAAEVRRLRAIASLATSSGMFRLEGQDALSVAERMHYANGVDPTLAVYAAYAYQGMARRQLIGDLSRSVRHDLGISLFDIEMLAGNLDDTLIHPNGALPPVPLLSQGWSLLAAHRIVLDPAFAQPYTLLQPSPWTLFNPQGVGRLRGLFARGEIGK